MIWITIATGIVALLAITHSVGVRVTQRQLENRLQMAELQAAEADNRSQLAEERAEIAMRGVTDIARLQLGSLIGQAKPLLERLTPDRVRSTFQPPAAGTSTNPVSADASATAVQDGGVR